MKHFNTFISHMMKQFHQLWDKFKNGTNLTEMDDRNCHGSNVLALLQVFATKDDCVVPNDEVNMLSFLWSDYNQAVIAFVFGSTNILTKQKL